MKTVKEFLKHDVSSNSHVVYELRFVDESEDRGNYHHIDIE